MDEWIQKQTTDKSGATWNCIEKLVSKKKNRFVSDGFDLDLTYVVDNVIAMGFPAEGIHALYRNSMVDVKNFFNKKYPSRHKIYNLCSERTYGPNEFYD